MKVLNRSSDGLKRDYTVFIAPDEVESAFVEKLKEKVLKTNIHGFRPGKAPAEVVRRIYGASLRAEVVQNLLSDISEKIIKKENLLISLNFSKEIIKEDDKGIEFSLKFEILPQIELKDVSSLEITKHIAEITDKEVNAIFDEVRKNRKNWVEEPAGESVKDGDKVSVSLLAKMKRKNNDKNTAGDIDIVIGDPNVIEDFWKPLIGKKAGNIVDFTVNYPKNLKDKTIAGKTIEYSANIKKISKVMEYELNDEFAKSLGYENFKKLHTWAEEKAQNYYERMSRNVMKRDLLEKISELYDFEVPSNILNSEFAAIFRQLTSEAERMGKKMGVKAEKGCRKLAEDRVRLGFVIAEISRKEGITVSKEEIAKGIKNIASVYPGHERAIFDMYSQGAALNSVVAPILEDKIVDFLFGVVKIKEKKCSVKQLVDLDEETFDFFDDNDAAVDNSKRMEEQQKNAVNARKTKKTDKESAAEEIKAKKKKGDME